MEHLPRMEQRRSRGLAAAKTPILVGSEQLDGCGEHEEHHGASAHLMGYLVEDGERRSGWSPVSSWSG
jgi:hypothetical protein